MEGGRGVQSSSQKKIKEGVVLRSKDFVVFLTTSNILKGEPLFPALAISLGFNLSPPPTFYPRAQASWVM